MESNVFVRVYQSLLTRMRGQSHLPPHKSFTGHTLKEKNHSKSGSWLTSTLTLLQPHLDPAGRSPRRACVLLSTVTLITHLPCSSSNCKIPLSAQMRATPPHLQPCINLILWANLLLYLPHCISRCWQDASPAINALLSATPHVCHAKQKSVQVPAGCMLTTAFPFAGGGGGGPHMERKRLPRVKEQFPFPLSLRFPFSLLPHRRPLLHPTERVR